MPIPVNTPWALNQLNNIEATVPGQGTTLYNNKEAPSNEVQLYGILHNVPLSLQEINYQFDMLYKFNEWVKSKQKNGIIDSSTARVYTATDAGAYLKFTSASAVTYTINAGIAQLWDTVEIQQGGAGAVTLVQGTGTVTFNRRAGFAPKTSGVGGKITMVKVSQGSGIESWDVWGDLGT